MSVASSKSYGQVLVAPCVAAHIMGRQRRGAFVILLLLGLLFAMWCGAQEPVATTIVGLNLQGQKPYERLLLSDFDIVIVEDTVRYVPLLRLCRELGLTTTHTGEQFSVSSKPLKPFTIDLAARTLQLEGAAALEIDLLSGVSDVTGQFDLFLREPDVASLLDITLEWDEQTYGYWAKTRSQFPAWAREDESQRRVAGKRAAIGLDLPLAALTGPSKCGDPSLHFLQIGGRVSVTNADYVRSSRLLNGYGRLAGGRYVARFRQSTNELSERPTMERVSLTHRFGDMETVMGDANIELSDLVMPSLNVFGGMVAGHFGLTESEREIDRTNFGRQDNFSGNERIRGIAPLGSKVELQINEVWSAVTEIESEAWEGAGFGYYDFRDVSVSRDRVSDIRVVITEADGAVTERKIRPVGTTQLMNPGNVMVAAVGGQRRFVTGDFFSTQGFVGGGRCMVGVTPYLTLGGAAAYQNRFGFVSLISEESSFSAATFPPRESEHVGGTMRLRLFRKDVLSVESSANRSKFDYSLLSDSTLPSVPYDSVAWSDQALGLRTSFETYWGSWLKLTPHLFHFAPGYYNGTNSELNDRQGFAAQLRLEPTSRYRLNVTHGQIENNVDDKLSGTIRQTWDHLDFPLPRLGLGFTTRLFGDRLRTEVENNSDSLADSDEIAHVATAELRGGFNFVDAQATISVGDELQPRQEEDLLRGFQLPNATTTARPGWSLQLSRKLLKNGSLSLSHSKQEFRELTRISHVMRATETNHWVWRVDAGFDWREDDWTVQAQPEYFFDRNGSTKISGLVRYLNGEVVWQIGIRFEPTLSFVGGRPLVVPYSKVTPSNGGIKGRVFIDRNGNGVLEKGEEGVKGVEVVAEGGRRAISGEHGEFLIGGSAQKRRTRIALDPKKLPIEFTATGGQQWVNLEPGNFSPARLSVARLGYIAGTLFKPDSAGTSWVPAPSARIFARNAEGKDVQESITYEDGTFYLGDLKPGNYLLVVDGATIPREFSVPPPSDLITLRDDEAGGLEIEGIELFLARK